MVAIVPPSPPIQRSNHPSLHLLRFQELERRAAHRPHLACALHDRNQQIAAPRHRDACGEAVRTVGHVEIIMPLAAVQPADTQPIAGRRRGEARGDPVDISHAIDLVIIGDAAVAIAEAELGTDVELSARACTIATNARPAGQPSRGNGQAISRQCADFSAGIGAR